MKTAVRRKTSPARKDNLPWSKATIDFDSSTGTQNTSDKKWISLAEMSITRMSFIQHINGNLQGKTGPEVGSDIYVYMLKLVCPLQEFYADSVYA